MMDEADFYEWLRQQREYVEDEDEKYPEFVLDELMNRWRHEIVKPGEVVDVEIDTDHLYTSVSIRLDRDELAAVQARADALNMPVTKYLKYAALRWVES